MGGVGFSNVMWLVIDTHTERKIKVPSKNVLIASRTTYENDEHLVFERNTMKLFS